MCAIYAKLPGGSPKVVLYDAFYLALADICGYDFWTSDQRFVNAAHGLPYVRHIRDFTPGLLET